ncbi:MAG: class I SAM-dependent methyltransferase, partial [Candidatus Marinimicrobia bacterium]|nr:class I SAM-dependent methyltransferase [Candidatus Neomarinimicrobiota bacterium]
MDISKASNLLNITPQQVRNLCRDRKIPSEKISGRWLLYEHDVHNYYDNNSCGTAENQETYYTNEQVISSNKPIALSFFSGAMGLDLGLEKAGFEIHTVENVGIHYSKTIAAWYDNWMSNKDAVIAKYGEMQFRMYQVFLGWSVRIADIGGSSAYQ